MVLKQFVCIQDELYIAAYHGQDELLNKLSELITWLSEICLTSLIALF